MIKLSSDNFSYFKSEEEFYNYFIALREDKHINILYQPIFKSHSIFSFLIKNELIDIEYVKSIEERFGKYYTGEDNEKAIFDADTLIKYIVSRETINGYTKNEIEDFFIYCLSKIFSSEQGMYFDRKTIITPIEKLSGKDEFEFEIRPIPKDIKEMRLKFYNTEQILENVAALKEIVNDKAATKLISTIEKQLSR